MVEISQLELRMQPTAIVVVIFTTRLPSGYLALCTANQPCTSRHRPTETDDASPQKFFDIVTYTGNGTSQSISTLNFSPELGD